MSMQLDRKLSGVDFDGARKSIDKLIRLLFSKLSRIREGRDLIGLCEE